MSDTPNPPAVDIPPPADNNPFARLDGSQIEPPPGPPPAPEKRGRGRPPGSKNKNKESTGPELPPPPASVPDLGIPKIDTTPENPPPPTMAKTAQDKLKEVLVDPKRTAKTLATFMDGGIGAVVSMRHGKAAGDFVKASPEEMQEIETAILILVQSAGVKMTPMQNFAVTMAGIYGIKIGGLELAAFQQKRAARG